MKQPRRKALETPAKATHGAGSAQAEPAPSCCPLCGADLAAWLDTACPAHMGRKGSGKAKARTSEQASAAANARWEKYRAAKKRPPRKGQNVADQTPAALDSANTTGSSSRLAASVLFVLGCSWWFLL